MTIKLETVDDVKEAQMNISDEFINNWIYLASLDPNLKILNFIKTAVKMPNGGLYLLQLQHVDGLKVDMDAYREEIKKANEEDASE